MALKTFVKIGGINNLSDARYCAGMIVDILGFSFEPQDPNFMGPDKYTAIAEWISGVAFAAEFDESEPEQIREILQQYPQVDYLQITRPEFLPSLNLLQVPIILKIDLESQEVASLEQLLENTAPDVTYFLLENSEENPDPQALEKVLKLAGKYPILLGFGLSQENVLETIENHPLKGIALKGGDEIKPGYKDFDDLADILETIEVDDLEE
ncbi:phosphoribosylanthranilate isomerase [Catalinimonas alkaloidigena]|uniref:phosphoribosylanthranilate isomerase n=1 Tax=Catalinimonas alkaloidigena TaxID=1075417 RepID=UPI002407337F|nr:phosphoribosylanthranilate isomerase [Catalinimonas alkaloidigena]MDF9795944.1 phosphoribosylanthranilate isomerase [Catalinimonas alkaloidigena]